MNKNTIEYVKLFWHHEKNEDPVVILYKVHTENERLASKSIDVFSDRKTKNIDDLYEGAIEITPIPEIEEFNAGVWGKEFYACVITEEEFEETWKAGFYYESLGIVKKSAWKTVEMPDKTEHFTIERSFTSHEIQLIKEGHKPKEMEDKWFMYYEDDKLYIHRSWTGFCIYIVSGFDGILNVTVNRDPEQYKETDIESDIIQLNILLNSLTKEKDKNAELMKKYFERQRNKGKI